MKAKLKSAKKAQGAEQIAEIMYAALQRFPKEEQEAKVRAVEQVKIVKNRRRTCFPSSVVQS